MESRGMSALRSHPVVFAKGSALVVVSLALVLPLWWVAGDGRWQIALAAAYGVWGGWLASDLWRIGDTILRVNHAPDIRIEVAAMSEEDRVVAMQTAQHAADQIRDTGRYNA